MKHLEKVMEWLPQMRLLPSLGALLCICCLLVKPITIPEVRRYRSYEEPDETPNRGAQFGSWLPHVM